jgi:prepilin-type N-terminal cleavage/methylation domain-containing protein
MRSGFTLLEVLVAVIVSAALLLAADAVFEQLADSRVASAHEATERDHVQNARELIRSWLRQVVVSPQIDASGLPHEFGGDSVAAHFTSSCIAPGGWERECQVTLGVSSDSTGAVLTAVSSTGDSASLRSSGRGQELLYLIDAANGGEWMRSWPVGPTVPIAVAVVTPKDTTVFRIGARG